MKKILLITTLLLLAACSKSIHKKSKTLDHKHKTEEYTKSLIKPPFLESDT